MKLALLASFATIALLTGCTAEATIRVVTATPGANDVRSTGAFQRATPEPTAAPRLILEKGTHWSHSSAYATFEGQVTNNSTASLRSVTALVTYYAADGTFITSDHALIEYNPLLVGQTSPFTVLTPYNPAMARGNVEFKFLSGGGIETTDR